MEFLNLLGDILKTTTFTLKTHVIKTIFSLQHSKPFELWDIYYFRILNAISSRDKDLLIYNPGQNIGTK